MDDERGLMMKMVTDMARKTNPEWGGGDVTLAKQSLDVLNRKTIIWGGSFSKGEYAS